LPARATSSAIDLVKAVLLFLAGALMPMGNSHPPNAPAKVERKAEAPIQKPPVQLERPGEAHGK
jgi:hypothetical protein